MGFKNSTPHGSVISPVLFNIMINDIFSGIGGGFGRSLFADDGALWKRGRNVDYVLRQAQVALDSVVAWGDKWDFRVSASKSNYMIFGSKRKLPERGLTIYGAPLERVKVFKFLGVWLDERLTWAAHIAKVVEQGEKVLNAMRCLAGCDWGADRGSLQLVYQAMIRSYINYGCFVYGSAAKSVLHKLEVLQARALRLCCGAFRSSPVPALLVEMGELLLSLRRVKLGLQYWAKLSASGPSFPARRLLQSSWESGSGAKRRMFFE